MKHKYMITVIPGDGIGPIVINEALKVIERCSNKYNINFDLHEVECGAGYYLRTGRVWESDTFEECKRADCILLGAIGLPGVEYETSILFELRSGLDLYANVRPIKLYPNVKHRISNKLDRIWNTVDLVIVRENTEDLYIPIRGFLDRNDVKELAIDSRILTRKGAERVIKFAFDLCRHRVSRPKNKVKRVTCVDKSNVTSCCKLFREIFKDVAKTHPDIETDYVYVDAFTQWLLRKPEFYDVVVTTNMFGDILSDLASVIQGGLGMAPSGNIGENHAMFEPVHGSAPDILNTPNINPVGAILSVKMMFEWLGTRYDDYRLLKSADDIENAVFTTFKDNICTSDVGGSAKYTDVGSAVCDKICIV